MQRRRLPAGLSHEERTGVGGLVAVGISIGGATGVAVAIDPGGAGIAAHAEGVGVGRAGGGGHGALDPVLVVVGFACGGCVPEGVRDGGFPGPATGGGVGSCGAEAPAQAEARVGVDRIGAGGDAVEVEPAVEGDRGAGRGIDVCWILKPAPLAACNGSGGAGAAYGAGRAEQLRA